MVAISPLFQTIQIFLLVGSSALIIGILWGMRAQTQDMRLDVLSRGSGKGSDLRRERRVKCNLFIEIMDHQDRVAGIGRLLNLSPTGACIASTYDLRRGEPVLARLPTLRSGANRISGHVIWAHATPGKIFYGVQLNRTTAIPAN